MNMDNFIGRPPKEPSKKVGTPVRALVTNPVALALAAAAEKHGIPQPNRGTVASDILRLYMYQGLDKDGLLTDEMKEDPSWASLKERGLL